jgi:hypothetical protein
MTTAANFAAGPSSSTPLYPLPRIDYFTVQSIQVNTSAGPKAATEITIQGSNFAIRAVDPVVVVNGIPLVRFRISDDTQSITGYFFAPRPSSIYSVIVDYGGGVRGEWTGSAVTPTGPDATRFLRLFLLLLIVLLLLLLLLAVLLLALRGTALFPTLGWVPAALLWSEVIGGI